MARAMCQSCAMPIKAVEDRGTEANGKPSQKYCVHCYKDGQFIWKDATAEQMQTYCMGILTNEKHMPAFVARIATRQIPDLERWRARQPVKH